MLPLVLPGCPPGAPQAKLRRLSRLINVASVILLEIKEAKLRRLSRLLNLASLILLGIKEPP